MSVNVCGAGVGGGWLQDGHCRVGERSKQGGGSPLPPSCVCTRARACVRVRSRVSALVSIFSSLCACQVLVLCSVASAISKVYELPLVRSEPLGPYGDGMETEKLWAA